jgi:hypothetical protein
MRNPPEEEPFYAVAARWLRRLAEQRRESEAAAGDAGPAPIEDPPEEPFSRLIGFLSDEGET